MITLSALLAYAVSQTGVSRRMINYIKGFEGLSLKPYLDAAGKPTIGYGHLIKSHEHFDDPISLYRAEKLLIEDIKVAEKCIDLHVKVKLTQNQRDALVSFIYNIGCGAFSHSTLLKKLNAGNYWEASEEFSKWTRAGGRILAGLVTRRAKEATIFRSA